MTVTSFCENMSVTYYSRSWVVLSSLKERTSKEERKWQCKGAEKSRKGRRQLEGAEIDGKSEEEK
jgi:hypothetical protein